MIAGLIAPWVYSKPAITQEPAMMCSSIQLATASMSPCTAKFKFPYGFMILLNGAISTSDFSAYVTVTCIFVSIVKNPPRSVVAERGVFVNL